MIFKSIVKKWVSPLILKYLFRVGFLSFSLIYCTTSSVFAQQEPMYSQYMFNMLPLNPAYAGSRDVVSLVALQRHQWVGIPGAPRTTTFSADAPFFNEKVGLGLVANNDVIGIFNNTQIQAVASYRIRIKKSTLAFGMNAGVTQYRANFSDVRTLTEGDNAFTDNFKRNLPLMGAGLFYSNDRFYVGFSIPRLFSNTLTVFNNNEEVKQFRAFQSRHSFLTAGYVFRGGINWVFKPSAVWKFVPGSPTQLDLNFNAWYLENYGIGLSYRSADAVSVLLEWQITDQVRFGYAYDWSHTRLRYNTWGSHEIMVRYEFGYNKARMLSPRYF